jgi:hypothetical protein
VGATTDAAAMRLPWPIPDVRVMLALGAVSNAEDRVAEGVDLGGTEVRTSDGTSLLPDAAAFGIMGGALELVLAAA